MPKSPDKTTVSVTPGQNEKVNNVIKFEDLVQNLKQSAAKPAGARAAVPAQQREHLKSIQQLAAELEQRLRALRKAMPDREDPPPARDAKRRKGKP
jgi:hypothetical protein